MLNQVSLIGRVGKDPEVRAVGANKVANLTLATTEKWRDKNTGDTKERTDWHNVVVWDPLAKVVEQYIKKGALVYVQGRLQTRKWQDQSGSDRYTTEVVLSGPTAVVKMLDTKKAETAKSSEAPAEKRNSYAEATGRNGYSGSSGPDDEIPF